VRTHRALGFHIVWHDARLRWLLTEFRLIVNEAIRIAAKIPGAWHGCVEIRPIADDAPTLRVLAAGAAP